MLTCDELGKTPRLSAVTRGDFQGWHKQTSLGVYLIKDNEIKDKCLNIANRKRAVGKPSSKVL